MINVLHCAYIKEWEKLCKRHRMSRVLIWSLDADLTAYDRHP